MVMKAGLVELSWTAAFQVVNFLILFWVMKKLLFKPVSEFMNNRTNEIESSIKKAEDKNRQAEELLSDYKNKLSNVQEEGRQIIREKTKVAQVKYDEIVKEAQVEARRRMDKAEVEIEREKQKATAEIKDSISSLVVAATSKVLNKELNENTHKELIENFIDEVGDSSWQN
ncbi:MAG: F0F1 ATP synthase subunit B [Anaeromicrobium sp.]|jgi:F-type H+-transporting ATPase subunit b|uniref:F0F1 ATP synthase subunit B n=1 Tax=Anaeromicrobium sp. TaxID=1929132 RepID=UPI0025D14398|nr:F0F1 ATP synthase subunit B [Anaeromicrobium sp.]MCT4592771.1 F0F1 ATP synthase subunit B [Anaeromicrobium sp.]